MSWITNAVSGLFSVVSKPLEEWQKRKTLKVEQRHELDVIDHEAKKAAAQVALKMAENGQQQDYDLDKLSMENMNKSWKDELVLVVFLAPMIMAFFPNTAPYALEGFKIIDKMPDWYIAIIIGMVVVIYGLRGLLKAYLTRKAAIKASDKTPAPTSTPATRPRR